MSTFRSNVILYLVLAVAFVAFQVAQAQSDITKEKYCGKNLANALQLLCNGIYNSMFKKSGLETELDDYPYTYDYPLRSKTTAMRFGSPRFRRQTRGVHDECCVKSCSIDELTSYCGR